MLVTRHMVAEGISSYLRGRQTLAEVVARAEDAMREGEFDEGDFAVIPDVLARLGLADVAAFGLTWENAVDMLSRLGYWAKVEVRSVRT